MRTEEEARTAETVPASLLGQDLENCGDTKEARRKVDLDRNSDSKVFHLKNPRVTLARPIRVALSAPSNGTIRRSWQHRPTLGEHASPPVAPCRFPPTGASLRPSRASADHWRAWAAGYPDRGSKCELEPNLGPRVKGGPLFAVSRVQQSTGSTDPNTLDLALRHAFLAPANKPLRSEAIVRLSQVDGT